MNSTLRDTETEINKIIDHAKIRKCSKPDCKEKIYSVHSATQAILALIQRKQVEARIDELEKIEIGGDNIWTVDNGEDMAMLILERIKELSKQAVKVKAVKT